MPVNYNIDIHVDPLVRKWFDSRFKRHRGVYQLGDSCWYGLVSAMLYQSKRVTGGGDPALPDKYSRFVQVKIGITEYDFYHYGWEVSPIQELRFSRMIRTIVVDECLRSAAIMRARYDIPLSQAINTYTVYYDWTEEDIHFETLRKIYRRHYRDIEYEYRELDQAAVTDFGVTEADIPRRSLRLRTPKEPEGQLRLF